MDPLAAWKELLDAVAEMDWERVLETAENLLEWITNGGFPPEVIALIGDGPNDLARSVYGPELNRSIVEVGCRFAIQLANGMLTNSPNDVLAAGFTLSCVDCDAHSPATFDEAVNAGWTRIRFVPESPAENYLGLCPECRTISQSSD